VQRTCVQLLHCRHPSCCCVLLLLIEDPPVARHLPLDEHSGVKQLALQFLRATFEQLLIDQNYHCVVDAVQHVAATALTDVYGMILMSFTL
jgi:hypothetical protein